MSFPYGVILQNGVSSTSGWSYTNGVLIFTNVGSYTLTLNAIVSVDYIVVGGRGMGGNVGEKKIGTTSLQNTIYSITVGKGGDSNSNINGLESIFATVIADGGFGDSEYNSAGANGVVILSNFTTRLSNV